MRLYLAHQEVKDFRALVQKMGDFAFASPRRSTVPLLDFWREPMARLTDLSRRLGSSEINDPSFHFEYPVAVQGGRGKPSFTDLMIKATDVVIAIEAKHREPEYESCSTWLGDTAEGGNRRLVLGGWLKYINDATGAALSSDSVAHLPYQLIHRAASLFSIGGSERYLVYQVFEEGEKKGSVPERRLNEVFFSSEDCFQEDHGRMGCGKSRCIVIKPSANHAARRFSPCIR
jgi:hypothetical protein